MRPIWIISFGVLLACEGRLGNLLENGKDPGQQPSAPVGPQPGEPWSAPTPCKPVSTQRVSRLSDGHFTNSIRDLLAVAKPSFETGALDSESFLPAEASVVTPNVALKLQELAETVAKSATAPGSALVNCAGDQVTCAKTFISSFGARAFRRPLTSAEETALLKVYTDGRDIDGTHNGGISLVIEAVLQAPSMLYLSELGTPIGAEAFELTTHEVASKLSYFLRNSIPDDALWAAAQDGSLASPEVLRTHVDRLLATPEVQKNLTEVLSRFFGLASLSRVQKGPRIVGFSPAVAQSMYEESSALINDVLWNQNGTLSDLLTSRSAQIDARLAPLYGLSIAPEEGKTKVELPAKERAGILTRLGLLTVKASPDETSVVYRGLMAGRGLLCYDPGHPTAMQLEQGEVIRKTTKTERGRAEARAAIPSCRGCHSAFDPMGIAFENYDTVGRFRTTQSVDGQTIPIDPSGVVDIGDVTGPFASALELNDKISRSRAVRWCMTQQLTSYALGARLDEAHACTAGDLAQRFEQNGGNLRVLLKDIASWSGIRSRTSTGAKQP
jgi:Protein of unknown function (DUF1592)/Protein of unknown function (DUF1588)/Protein of unknown function (DUF1595)/Protein of unknown function (DUF1585)